MSDKNYKPLEFANVHGTPDKWVEVTVDTRSVAGFWIVRGHPNALLCGMFPSPYADLISDTIKMSNCSYLRVIVLGTLVGGKEDCLDVNNGSHHVEVIANYWESRGKYVCTIKGGSHNVRVAGHIIHRGSEMDVDLGNWSDQSQKRTKFVTLCFTCDYTVRYRVLHAWAPTIENYAQRYQGNDRWKGIFEWGFSILKKLHLA